MRERKKVEILQDKVLSSKSSFPVVDGQSDDVENRSGSLSSISIHSFLSISQHSFLFISELSSSSISQLSLDETEDASSEGTGVDETNNDFTKANMLSYSTRASKKKQDWCVNSESGPSFVWVKYRRT